MPKKILLIESDAAFAREMAHALEQKGFTTQTAGDGNEGLALARDLSPDGVVLCVELPGMSGYSICNKLRKDEALKAIPLIIISAEATPETFEQHKKLKARAEDYLIKPFTGETLLEHLSALVGTAEGGEEEVVTLADVELEALGSLETGGEMRGDEPAAAQPAGLAPRDLPDDDEDLKLLDDAFDSIAAKPAPPASPRAEKPVDQADLAAAVESLPEANQGSARSDLGALGDEADAALQALSAGDEGTGAAAAGMPDEPAAPPPRPASADLLRAAGIPILESELPRHSASSRTEQPASAREPADHGEIESLRRQLEEARASAARAEREANERDGDLKLQKTKLEGMSATVKRLEVDLKNAREETRRALDKGETASSELAVMRDRLQEAERLATEKAAAAAEAQGRLAALEGELEVVRAELVAARGEAEGARGEVDKRTGDLQARVQELEAATSKHEERVLKAYQKIKSDEKLREKTRKALLIALQLLDERGAAASEPGEPLARPSPRE